MPSIPPVSPTAATAYREALKGRWASLMEHYDQEGIEQMQFPITLAGDNALHIAVYSQRKKPLSWLLEKFENEISPEASPSPSLVTIRNYFGNTPLHEAVLTENFKAVQFLATRYPELRTIVNNKGETPLFQAASYSDIKIVRYLASIDSKDSKSQPTAGQQRDPNLPSQPATALPGLSSPDIQDSNSQPAAAGQQGIYYFPEIHRQRNDRTSILHVAVQGGHFETALLLLNLDESLKDLKDGADKTALHYLAAMPSAFKSGYPMDIFSKFLYFLAPVEDHHYNKNENTTPRQQRWVPETYSSCFNKPDIEAGQSRNPQNQHYCRSIYSFVHKVLQAINLLLWTYVLRGWPIFQELYDNKKMHGFALRLAKLLIENDHSWYYGALWYLQKPPQAQADERQVGGKVDNIDDGQQKEDVEEDKVNVISLFRIVEEKVNAKPDQKQSIMLIPASKNGIQRVVQEVVEAEESTRKKKKQKEVEQENKGTPLFIATRNGILEIVEEILAYHPMAVEYANESGQNILHLSVLHRQEDIFDLVTRVSIPLARLRRAIDSNGYTLLHQVADTKYFNRGTSLGPALQLKSELELFERVRASIPSHYVMRRDRNHMTAEELFAKHHQVHLTKARTWIKDTCQSCSTVAVLVAGVVFAAAFAVPGGFDSNGNPNHLCSNYFMVFAVMDVISLASSLTSVVMFLSVITSPLELRDFHKSIPRKLTLGFALLFFSVMATMVAFGASIFILLQSENLWTNWFIYIAAFCPILVFAVVQFRMYLAFGVIMLDYLRTIAYYLIPGWASLSRRAKTSFFQPKFFH